MTLSCFEEYIGEVLSSVGKNICSSKWARAYTIRKPQPLEPPWNSGRWTDYQYSSDNKTTQNVTTYTDV